MTARDLSGRRFGRLLVLERAGTDRNGNALWLCRCDCGGEVVRPATSLVSGNTRSCGCLRKSAEFRGKMKSASEKGVSASVQDGIQLASASRTQANANSSTGIRGVSWDAKRQYYIASAQLAGDRLVVTGIKSLEEAERIRSDLRNQLEEKHNYKKQPDED